MATEKTPSPSPLPTVETEIARDRSMSFEGGTMGGESSVTENDSEGASIELSLDGSDTEKKPDAPEEEGGEPDDKKAEEEAGELGDYDGSPEAREKFDAKYLTKAEDGKPGQLNREALAAEFAAGRAKAGDKATDHGHMNESTYKWIEDTFAVDRAFITDYEKGLVALQQQATTSFFSTVEGGEAAYRKAVEWGKGGGYSEAQRTRFNDALRKGGEDAADAVEALMARFTKANPKPQDRGPGRRRSSPQRDPSGRAAPAGGAGGDVFKTRDEYSQAWAEGLAAKREARGKNDREAVREADKKLDALRAKARRSRFAD